MTADRPPASGEPSRADRVAEIVAEFYEDRDQTDERVAVENLARALAICEEYARATPPSLVVDGRLRLLRDWSAHQLRDRHVELCELCNAFLDAVARLTSPPSDSGEPDR